MITAAVKSSKNTPTHTPVLLLLLLLLLFLCMMNLYSLYEFEHTHTYTINEWRKEWTPNDEVINSSELPDAMAVAGGHEIFYHTLEDFLSPSFCNREKVRLIFCSRSLSVKVTLFEQIVASLLRRWERLSLFLLPLLLTQFFLFPSAELCQQSCGPGVPQG